MAPEPARFLARIALVCALATIAVPAHALRIVDWNVLNYPGTTGPTRDPSYRTVLAPLGVDILVTEEQTSQTGATAFLNNLNTMEPGQWAAAPFIVGGDTQAAMFYKPAKVTFLGQRAFYPNSVYLLRQVNLYRFKPVGYTGEAAEFSIYAVHLKASTGSANVTTRLQEATGLRDTLNALPAGTHFLVMGDYNFYSGTEGGFLKLLENQVDNDGQSYDPLGLQGLAWQDNTAIQYAWTQSPCKTGDTGCAPGAATGGMDDRFDLILASNAFNNGAGFELVPGTYACVGNDGLHHNNSIQDAPTIPEGAAYATALHSVSDHLPVRVDVSLPAILQASSSPIAFGTVIVGAPNPSQSLAVANLVAAPGEELDYSYAAPAGFTAPAGTLHLTAGTNQNDALAMDASTVGVKAGTLVLSSNSLDAPGRSISLSGNVLRHASASFDSAVAINTTATLDFGSHAAADFTTLDVRVHNFGWDAQQAQLLLSGASITGGNGHFSLAGGSTPVTLGGVGQTYTVAFDPTDATADSEYTATLSFTSSDEPLPGAAAQPALDVTLRATLTSGGTTGVVDALPAATHLYSPYPNPLRGSSTLRFDVARAGDVAVEIFDVAGRRAATLVHGSLEAGRYSVQWNGVTESGDRARAGLYFVRLSAPDIGHQTARLAVVK